MHKSQTAHLMSKTHHYTLVSTTHSKRIINNQKPKPNEPHILFQRHKRSVSAGFGTDVARIFNLLFPWKGQSNTVLLSSLFQHLQSATAHTVFHRSLRGAIRREIEKTGSYEIVKHFPAFLMPESRLCRTSSRSFKSQAPVVNSCRSDGACN